MQLQEIVFGQANQAFWIDPPDGRPTGSPTVVALDDGMPVPATTGECTVDPVSTVLHGDAHRGSKLLRVASTDGIVIGRRYLMTKPERDREWIEVVAIRGTTLVLRHPLVHRYAGAATIEGCRISIGVASAWVNKSTNLSDHRSGLAGYLLRWSYTIDGHEVSSVSFADLVRVRSEQMVAPADVDARFPGFISGLPAEHRENQGADFIAEAFRAIRLEAVGDDHSQRKIRDTRVLQELVRARAQVIRLEQSVMYGEPRGDELRVAEERYHKRYAHLVAPKPVAAEPWAPPPTKAAPKGSAEVIAKGSAPGVRRIPKLTRH